MPDIIIKHKLLLAHQTPFTISVIQLLSQEVYHNFLIFCSLKGGKRFAAAAARHKIDENILVLSVMMGCAVVRL